MNFNDSLTELWIKHFRCEIKLKLVKLKLQYLVKTLSWLHWSKSLCNHPVSQKACVYRTMTSYPSLCLRMWRRLGLKPAATWRQAHTSELLIMVLPTLALFLSFSLSLCTYLVTNWWRLCPWMVVVVGGAGLLAHDAIMKLAAVYHFCERKRLLAVFTEEDSFVSRKSIDILPCNFFFHCRHLDRNLHITRVPNWFRF